MRESINHVCLFKLSYILKISCHLILKLYFKKLKKENNQEFQCILYNIVDISAITLGMYKGFLNSR